MGRDTKHLFAILALAVASAACAREAKIEYATVREVPIQVAGEATLVAIDDGIWVVRNADHAVYYVGDWYWVIDDGNWYRSSSFEVGWAKVEERAVPRSIVHRNHGYYTLYQGEATAPTRRPPIAHSQGATISERMDQGVKKNEM